MVPLGSGKAATLIGATAGVAASAVSLFEGITSLLTALAAVLAAAGVVIARLRRRHPRRSTRPRRPGPNATPAERQRYIDQLEQFARDHDDRDSE